MGYPIAGTEDAVQIIGQFRKVQNAVGSDQGVLIQEDGKILFLKALGGMHGKQHAVVGSFRKLRKLRRHFAVGRGQAVRGTVPQARCQEGRDSDGRQEDTYEDVQGLLFA